MTIRRVALQGFRGLLVTPDMKAALQAADDNARQHGYAFEFSASEPDRTGQPPLLSLAPAGREVCVQVKPTKPVGLDARQRLEVCWSLLVPYGFTPWTRYPLPQPGSEVFHYFGPWAVVRDRLLSEGRGHLAWASSCAAAQADAGVWEGPYPLQVYVQAQLHRLGYNPGAVDGDLGNKTMQAIRAVGVRDKTLTELAAILTQRDSAPRRRRKSTAGNIVIPGREVNVSAYGDVAASRSATGAKLTISGPGRVILDIGGIQ